MDAQPRNPDELLVSALSVIDHAYDVIPLAHPHTKLSQVKFVPLFSGGHDSYSACFCAAQHPKFDGKVYHINTGIGSKRTRKFVEDVCRDEGWSLVVTKSNTSYESLVRKGGFPTYNQHMIFYHRLKRDGLVVLFRKWRGLSKRPPISILINGARKQESRRRMGNTDPVRIGDRKGSNDQKTRDWVWVSPCHDWSKEEQRSFMDAFALPRNPVKESMLAKSGECFCGAFARPYELALLKEVCPDVYDEIDRLTDIALANGHPEPWGNSGYPDKPIPQSGPLCSSCDQWAESAGILFQDFSNIEEEKTP